MNRQPKNAAADAKRLNKIKKDLKTIRTTSECLRLNAAELRTLYQQVRCNWYRRGVKTITLLALLVRCASDGNYINEILLVPDSRLRIPYRRPIWSNHL